MLALLRTALPVTFRSCMIKPMTDKQAVIDALQRLPEDVSIEEITEELRIMAAIRRGRADIAAGRTRTQEEAECSLESWATAWTSR
jgi:predicted transcriptional regulator